MGLQVVLDTVGVPQLNGTYDLDFEFTMGELHLIKQHAGLRGLEVDDAMEAGDTDLILCLGVIGALRSGRLKPQDTRAAVDELMKEKVGSIRLTDNDEEEEGTGGPEGSAGNEPGETQNSSSETSTPLSDSPQETTLEPTGVPI